MWAAARRSALALGGYIRGLVLFVRFKSHSSVSGKLSLPMRARGSVFLAPGGVATGPARRFVEGAGQTSGVEIVIIRKNKAVLNAEICPWSKVDGHSLLSNRVEFNLNPN